MATIIQVTESIWAPENATEPVPEGIICAVTYRKVGVNLPVMRGEQCEGIKKMPPTIQFVADTILQSEADVAAR